MGPQQKGDTKDNMIKIKKKDEIALKEFAKSK